jgi:hypothetical protein
VSENMMKPGELAFGVLFATGKSMTQDQAIAFQDEVTAMFRAKDDALSRLTAENEALRGERNVIGAKLLATDAELQTVRGDCLVLRSQLTAENERLRGEVERLTGERDSAESRLRQTYHEIHGAADRAGIPTHNPIIPGAMAAKPYMPTERLELLAAERARAEGLEKIVAKLPKTADGVPVTPGMKLYPLHSLADGLPPEEAADIDDHARVEIHLWDTVSSELLRDGDEADVTKCYSTREAAEAARQALAGGEAKA